MVRTAVKTLTLNVYAIPLPAVHQFVTSRPASAYFVELAAYIAEQCRVRGQLADASALGLLIWGVDGRCRGANRVDACVTQAPCASLSGCLAC